MSYMPTLLFSRQLSEKQYFKALRINEYKMNINHVTPKHFVHDFTSSVRKCVLFKDDFYCVSASFFPFIFLFLILLCITLRGSVLIQLSCNTISSNIIDLCKKNRLLLLKYYIFIHIF